MHLLAAVLLVVAQQDVSASSPSVADGLHEWALVNAHETNRILPADAARLCRYHHADDAWECDVKAASKVDIVTREEIAAPDELAVGFKAAMHESGCIAAVALVMQHPSKKLVVDWSEVMFAVDGTAVQAIPGFARQMTSSLAQRPSVAMPGVRLVETVHPITGECISTTSEAPVTTELVLPVKMDGEDVMLRWRYVRSWAPRGERYLMPLVRVQQPYPPHGDVPSDDDDEGGINAAYIGSAIGCILGVLGAGSCLTMGAMVSNGQIKDETARWVVLGSSGSCCAGVASSLSGIGISLVEEAVRDGRRKQRSRYEYESRIYNAYVRKMRELGLLDHDVPQAH